jgi:hypothetical protein
MSARERRHRTSVVLHIGFVVVLVLVAVAVLASVGSWPVLSFWLDVARLEIFIVVVLGGPAALVAGPAAYRAVLAAPFLIVATAVQFTTAVIVASEGPGCGSVVSDVSVAIAFGPALLKGMPIVLVGIVVVAPAFTYLVLSRRPLLVRMGAVAALLLALAGGIALVSQLHSSASSHCIDF